MKRIEAIGEQLKSTADGQISETDPDARSMISQAKGTGVVGYNVQAAVDAKNHLIVTHEVTNVGNDRSHLTKKAGMARDEMGHDRLQAIADRGYFNSQEVKACASATPAVRNEPEIWLRQSPHEVLQRAREREGVTGPTHVLSDGDKQQALHMSRG